MTTANITVPAARSSALPALARLEVRRYLRHPLYLIGAAVSVLTLVAAAGGATDDASPLSSPIAPAFLFGIFGIVIAAQLTRSAHKVGRATGVPPVPERTRTLAIAASFVVPVASAAAWVVAFFLLYRGRPPEGAWWFGSLPSTDVVAVMVGSCVVAAFGGPAIGLLLGRWVSWRVAPLVTALLLVVACMLTQGDVAALRHVRLLMPWTAWAGGTDGSRAVFYPGQPGWWVVYLLGLCALAVVAAVRHDRDADRNRCRAVAVGLAVVAVVAVALAMTTGVQHTRYAEVPSLAHSSAQGD